MKSHPSETGGQSRPADGFTLIEIMIAVAIVAILATIAYPSYTEFVRRGHRADAKAALLEDATFLQRNFTESYRYDLYAGDPDGVVDDPVTLPITQSPQQGTSLYAITATMNATGTTFTLTAAPIAGTLMTGDRCGSFTLDHLGQKGLSGATATLQDCWNR